MMKFSWRRPSRRELILYSAIAALLIIGGAILTYMSLTKKTTGPQSKQKQSENVAQATETGTTGSQKPTTTTPTDKKDTPKQTTSSPNSNSTQTQTPTAQTPPPASSSSSPTQTFPARWTVGAPGVGKYKQSDASLPVPTGYTVLNPHDTTNKVYNIYTCGTVNFDHVYIKASIYLGTGCYGAVNITNSIIAPPAGASIRAILNNSDGAQRLTINISNTTVRPEPVTLGGTNAALTDHLTNDCGNCSVHINRVDAANTGGLCLCGKDTIVENSWLHDNYIAHLSDPSLAHTGGVFPYGGSGPLTIRYNRLEPGLDAYNVTEVPNYWKAITAVLFTQSSGGSMLRNYQVYNNFISLGAFDIDLENGEGLVFRDNIFGPNHWGHTNSCFSSCPTFGEWTNNKVGDINGTPGAILPKPW